MADKKMNLVQKLAAIRVELNHIEKKGENKHFGYSYMRAEDVAGDIGDRFAAVNIVIGVENGRCEVHPMNKGFMVVTECTYKFIDGDSGESLTVWSCGAGYDTSDKGIYKARTGALKYALTQALCMRVGDDAEDDDGKPAERQTEHRARTNGNRFVHEPEKGAGEMASEADRKRLFSKAKQLMGAKAAAWIKDRMADLKVPDAEHFMLHQFMMLMNELEQLEAGEHVEPIDDDIPF